jgi:3-methyladenine DNA glycosylase AlkC
MPEKLKNLFFTIETINNFADRIKEAYPKYDKERFLKLVYDAEWDSRELKAKMRHVAISLHDCLPEKYEQAINILIRIAPYIKGFEGMVLPDYVELYGFEHWDVSLNALKEFTKYSSSEFAIRPFIIKDSKKIMKFMLELANDKNENIQRFASEGCRSRLPWAMAIPDFKKDPAPIIPILEKLKNDKLELVRRSVANNLNDISKDNPEIVLELCEKWIGKSEQTDWIIKHACRTLLKAGDKRALVLFGHEDPKHIEVEKFEVETKQVKIGDHLKYSFSLKVDGKREAKLRIEYAIDYLKANGSHNSKVFKITENTYQPGNHTFSKKHSFAEMSTRKHYPGLHKVSIIVNGENKNTKSFQVI